MRDVLHAVPADVGIARQIRQLERAAVGSCQSPDHLLSSCARAAFSVLVVDRVVRCEVTGVAETALADLDEDRLVLGLGICAPRNRPVRLDDARIN